MSESFAELFEESLKTVDMNTGSIVTGEVVDIDNEWVTVISNDKIDTLNNLTPAAISGTLKIPIGRIRKMRMGEQYISAFTVGDQLLWGAAEPLRRMLNILQNNTP